MSRCLLAAIAVCSLSLSGCGTFSDAICGPLNDQVYYRGVSEDISGAAAGYLFYAADITLSFVADTVLLPSEAYQEWKHPRPHLDLWRTETEQKAADKTPDDSFISPFERLFGFTTLGVQTVESVKHPQPNERDRSPVDATQAN
jgi:uncharacterized protein YceK